jgi:CheY-like chemotaxis protein
MGMVPLQMPTAEIALMVHIRKVHSVFFQVAPVWLRNRAAGTVEEYRRGSRLPKEVCVVRIFVVDDNPMIRSQIRSLLERREEWVVVGEASNGLDAVETCGEHTPNLTVMDLQMPEMNGLQAARVLVKQQPDVPILMITVDPSRQLEEEAKKAGIKGLCAKSQIRSLMNAVERLLQGKTYFPLARATA